MNKSIWNFTKAKGYVMILIETKKLYFDFVYMYFRWIDGITTTL